MGTCLNKKNFIDSCRQGWHMLVDMALTQGFTFRNHLNFCSKCNYNLKIVMNIWAVGLDYYMLGSYTMEITAEREQVNERDQYNKKGKSLYHTHAQRIAI